jgi:hypothetical protein
METYLVFARAAYADPLSFQGALEVSAGAHPNQLALDTYGSDWVELVLVPERDLFWAIKEKTSTTAEAGP